MNSQYTSYLFTIWKVVDSYLGVRHLTIHYQMQVKIFKRHDLCSGFYELSYWGVAFLFKNDPKSISLFLLLQFLPWVVNGKNIWEWLPSFSVTSSIAFGQDILWTLINWSLKWGIWTRWLLNSYLTRMFISLLYFYCPNNAHSVYVF